MDTTHHPNIKFSLDQHLFCGATDCPYFRLCDLPHGFQSQGGSLTCSVTCLHAVHCSCLICTFSYHCEQSSWLGRFNRAEQIKVNLILDNLHTQLISMNFLHICCVN